MSRLATLKACAVTSTLRSRKGASEQIKHGLETDQPTLYYGQGSPKGTLLNRCRADWLSECNAGSPGKGRVVKLSITNPRAKTSNPTHKALQREGEEITRQSLREAMARIQFRYC